MKKMRVRGPGKVNAALNQAARHFRNGCLGEAERILREILRSAPGHAGANHLLGLIAGQAGDHESARQLISRALKANPRNPVYHFNHSLALKRCGREREALEACNRAIKLDPANPDAQTRLGNLLVDAGRLTEAASSYRKALELQPGNAKTLFSLGSVLHTLGHLDDALSCYRKCIMLDPQAAEAHLNQGEILRLQGDLQQAISCFEAALRINPDFVEALNNLGVAHTALEQRDQALDFFRRALRVQPRHVDSLYNLGSVLRDLGDKSGAIDCYRNALALDPNLPRVRWALAVAQIPLVCTSTDEADAVSRDFSRELDSIEAWLPGHTDEETYQSVGSHTPFYLAYQERNNRQLLSRFGTLCSDLMQQWAEKHRIRLPISNAGPLIRVGIVSAHIYSHSVWTAIVKGWVSHLNRNNFSIQLFSLGTRHDDETRWAKLQCELFESGKKSLEEWASTIRNAHPDILLYPEIGMDPLTIKLASLRLAPVQAGTWGHPETTGLPTIDYYISAEGLEPANAHQHYTEELVLLPNLGCCYMPAAAREVDPNLSDMGIYADRPLLLCPGSPFKYAPSHDDIFVDLARRIKNVQLVFFTYRMPELSAKLYHRLSYVFDAEGLNFDEYGIFIPWQDSAGFRGLMRRADVFLDTIGFSGFNTAMQAVECGLPVVTCKAGFLRGRLAGGILNHMGLAELIAADKKDYVELVVRLVENSEYRLEVQRRMEQSCHALFNDLEPVRALEMFFKSITGNSVPPTDTEA